MSKVTTAVQRVAGGFRRSLSSLCLLLLGAGMTALVMGQAPDDETPIGKRWWPSEWGADDQRGAANRLTADKVLEAKELITTGKIYQLGRAYESGMPIPGK